MKYAILSAILFPCLGHANLDASKIKDGLMGSIDLVKDTATVLKNVSLSCPPTPQNQAIVSEEFTKMAEGIASTIAEQLQLLAYKKDFPTMCHVMSQNHIDMYTNSQKLTDTQTTGNSWFKDVRKTYQPEPVYYWPKYFIEVTQTTNDPYPAFAKGNLLYSTNRKIANSLTSSFPFGSSSDVTAIMLGQNAVTKVLNPILPNKISLKEPTTEEMLRGATLSPFEKLGIRGSTQGTQPIFNANIWPVGLSQTWAKYFSVCGKVREDKGLNPGGYAWDIPFVPMTCPVAMSQDIYGFWHTGYLDYVSPKQAGQMVLGSNPVTCSATQAMNFIASQGGFEGAKNSGSQQEVSGELNQMTEKLGKGLRTCSWPLLGKAEVIYKVAKDHLNPGAYKGPHCTVWGTTAPRISTAPFDTEFNFANKALQFKLLAHELMGVPRGNEERWSLAYPWEGPGSTGGSFKLGGYDFGNALAGLGNYGNELAKKAGIDMGSSSGSRAESLYIPGDPRLVDVSTNVGEKLELVAQYMKQVGYLASLGLISEEAAKKAVEAYGRIPKGSSSQEQLQKQKELTNDAVDESAYAENEVRYKKVGYCYRQDSDGLKTKQDKTFEGKPFQKGVTKEWCLRTDRHSWPGCQNWDGFWGGCKSPGRAWAIYREVMEFDGFTGRKIRNPAERKTYRQECEGRKYRSYKTTRRTKGHKKEKEIWTTNCYPVLTSIDYRDTRQYVDTPNGSRPETIIGHNPKDEKARKIISAATKAATWTGAELARLKFAEITGHNALGGKRRIYTVWEKIQCVYPSKLTDRTLFVQGNQVWSHREYNSCRQSIQFEVKKLFQLKYMRKLCDLFGQDLGKPFK